MMTRDEAIEKARKLLALATSDNPHEAAAAAARAQDILARYELDAAILSVTNQTSEPEEAVGDYGIIDGGRLSTWRWMFLSALLKQNGCFGYKGSGGVSIIGRASDVRKVRYMFEYLRREIDRLADKEGKGMGRSWNNQFRMGAAATVRERLNEQVKAMREEYKASTAGNSCALMVVNKALEKVDARAQEASNHFNQLFGKGKKSKSQARTGGVGYAAGRAAGYSVSLGGASGALGSGSKQIVG